jgi:hypothetical protein
LLDEDQIRSDDINDRGVLKQLLERDKNLEETATSFRDFTVLGSIHESSFIGFGTSAFFYILEMLMLLFLVLSVFGIGNMIFFYTYGKSKDSLTILDLIEMGNLGFSSSHCNDVSLEISKLSLE